MLECVCVCARTLVISEVKEQPEVSQPKPHLYYKVKCQTPKGLWDIEFALPVMCMPAGGWQVCLETHTNTHTHPDS